MAKSSGMQCTENELIRAVLCNDEEGVMNLIDEQADVNVVDEKGTSALHVAAFLGYESIINLLLDAGARIDARDQFWVTPLHRACWRDQKEALKVLLSRGGSACVTCRRFLTPLHVAAQHDSVNCAALLIQNSPAVIDKTDWAGCTALDHASFLGNMAVTELLIKNNANVNARNKKGRTAVHWAALGGHVDVLKALMGGGADMNTRDSDANTVLHYAALSGIVEVVVFVLENASMDIDCITTTGYTPLHYAVSKGNVRVVETLLANGANPSKTSIGDGYTALHLAAGYTDGTLCCEKLLDHGCDVNQLSADGSTALHFACEYGRIARARLLIAKGASVNAANRHGVTPVHVASRFGHDLILKHLLNEGAALNMQTTAGHTALHLAAYRGFVNPVRTLITFGADIGILDVNGQNALHVAAQSETSNSEYMIDYLLQSGADVSVKDFSGRTALHYATRSSAAGAVYKLLSAGADPNARDNSGLTALHFAALVRSEMSFKCAKHLCRADDACVQARDNSGFFPIHYAVRTDNVEISCLLADVMSDVSVPSSLSPHYLTLYHIAAKYKHAQLLHKLLAFYHMRSLNLEKEVATELNNSIGIEEDAKGWIPMHYAMANGCHQCVNILLGTAIRRKALICKDRNDLTPLHLAAACGQAQCVAYAVEMLKESEINVIDYYSRTPLMLAISSGSVGCIDLLLPKSDVTLVDKWRRGMVHRACAIGGTVAICAKLIERGADFTSSDCNGVTPLHLAAKANDVAVVELLLSKGAKEEQDSWGLLPIDWAAAEGNVSVLRCLRAKNLHSPSFNAVLLAAAAGYFDACEYLLNEWPKYVSAVDACGRTPLHLAARAGCVGIVQLLVSRGAPVNAVDELCNTPLMAVVDCEHKANASEIVDILLNAGASLSDRDVDGNNVLHLACLARNEDLARHLLSRADPVDESREADHVVNAQNRRNQTILHLACKAGMAAFLPEVITVSEYSLLVKDESGRTPLLAPIDDDDVAECVSFLVDTRIAMTSTPLSRPSYRSSDQYSRKTSSIGTTETDGDTF